MVGFLFALVALAPATAQASAPAESAASAVIAAINGKAADRAKLVRTAFSISALPNESAANDERN